MGCLSSVSCSVLINGRPMGKFRGFKGFRQGDPLSPFRFTMVADGLSRLMEELQRWDLLRDVGWEEII